MGVAISVKDYLERNHIRFELLEHRYCEGSYNTACVAKIPEQSLAKGVVFRDEDLHYTLVVLPCRSKVKRHTLNEIFDRKLVLADEDELDNLFSDCSHGAVPAVGQAYDLNVIWEDDLLSNEKIYIEAGDHRHLIQLNKKQFCQLMASSMHDHISTSTKKGGIGNAA